VKYHNSDGYKRLLHCKLFSKKVEKEKGRLWTEGIYVSEK
jgi:hypothetical protein